MAVGNIPADLIQSQLIINLLQEKIAAVKKLLLPFLKKFRGRITDKDFLIFIVLLTV